MLKINYVFCIFLILTAILGVYFNYNSSIRMDHFKRNHSVILTCLKLAKMTSNCDLHKVEEQHPKLKKNYKKKIISYTLIEGS